MCTIVEVDDSYVVPPPQILVGEAARLDLPDISQQDQQQLKEIEFNVNKPCTESLEKAAKWFEQWKTSESNPDDPAVLVDFFTQWTQLFNARRQGLQLISLDQPVRIILNVMMKNEQPIMERCIKSALPIVDAVCYTDTGSTGDVFTILKKTIPSNIPWHAEIEPWKNFGYNRTYGLDQTRRFAESMGWSLDRTYILVIDADMILKIDPKFDKNPLTADAYQVEQKNGGCVYWNVRLLKISRQWVVLGRTHEYYNSNLPSHVDKTNLLFIDDRSDGCNRADKFDRDIKLLLEDLKENPRNARSMFYLAESHRNRGQKDSGDYEKAIEYYRMHIDTGSWDEEVWWSYYAIGLCYERLNDEGMMLKSHLEAYAKRPHRAEPLFKLAKYYRDRNSHHMAMIFFRKALEIPFPSNDVLFVEHDIYGYGTLSESGISAFYAGEKNIGELCVQTILRKRNVPDIIRQMNYYNLRFYIQQFAPKFLVSLAPTARPQYTACNPSLIVHDEKLTIICRTVNYSQQNARNYKIRTNEKTYHTENVFMTIDLEKFKLSSEQEIKNEINGPYISTCKVTGLEDARIAAFDGSTLEFSCTSLEYDTSNTPRICWVTAQQSENGALEVKQVTRINGYEDNLVQKNWLPFKRNDQIQFIYGYNPVTVLEMNQTTKQVQVVNKFESTIETQGWRGSSGPVHLPGVGYLVLIHEVCDRSEGRHYMHRFVLFDEQITSIRSVSDLFYFKHGSGVEMATGMAYHKKVLHVTFGVEDSEAFLAIYYIKDVMERLRPV
jgi:tetratricopeptide (TPR) repeat protein